jgi:hypothetical protein
LYQAKSKSSRRTIVSTGCPADRRVNARRPRTLKVIAATVSRAGTVIRACAAARDVPIRPPPQVL